MCATCRARDIRSDLWDRKKTKNNYNSHASLSGFFDTVICAHLRECACACVTDCISCDSAVKRSLEDAAAAPPSPSLSRLRGKKKGGCPYYTIHQPPNSPYSSQMTFTNYFLPFLETAPWFLSGLRHAHCHVETNKLAVATVRVFFDWGGANVQMDLWCPFKGCCCVEQYG